MNSRLSGKRGGFEDCKPIQPGTQIKGIGTQPVILIGVMGRAGAGNFPALQPVLRGPGFLDEISLRCKLRSLKQKVCNMKNGSFVIRLTCGIRKKFVGKGVAWRLGNTNFVYYLNEAGIYGFYAGGDLAKRLNRWTLNKTNTEYAGWKFELVPVSTDEAGELVTA